MVVGGGPAGMECACTLAERGHDVTLYEKTGALGGRTKLAAMIKSGGCEEVMHIFDHLTAMVERSTVKVKLKTEVDERLIRQEAPDAVVVAISSPYYIPDIPGIDRKNVFTIPLMSKLAQVPLRMFGPDKLASMSEKFFPVGKKIVIWGAGAEGAQCAEFMRKRGKDIVLVAEDGGCRRLDSDQVQRAHRAVVRPPGRSRRAQRNGGEFGKQGARAEVCAGRRRAGDVRFHDGHAARAARWGVLRHGVSLVGEVYEIGSTLGGENAFFKHAFADGRRVGCLL